MRHLLAIGFVLIYVLLVGVATFVEKPAMKHLDALQINALLAVGAVPASLLALVFDNRSWPGLPSIGLGLGLGTVIAVGSIFYFLGLAQLHVSIAATISTAYVLVTFVMAVFILGEPITVPKVLGVVLTVAGVALLSYHGGS